MAAADTRPGPLGGLLIVEMAGLGPVPLAGLILAEMGATVVRVERSPAGPTFLPLAADVDLDRFGREAVALDLKSDRGRDVLRRMLARADVVIEGFRPGVMERLGCGPDEALAANPKLVYGRMTGFGQTGPLAARAGHDLTYLAYSGALHAIGREGSRPVIPLNLVADYGGGTMLLVAGVLAALVEAGRSGLGQVVDAAMVEGAAQLLVPTYAMMAGGLWQDRRGENLLDSGAPFYEVYETADGRHLAVACLEPQFFAEFARLLPLDPSYLPRQYDRSSWPAMRSEIADAIAGRDRDDWAALFEPTDACVAPVLSLAEAETHPHNRARGTHRAEGRLRRPGPAPRFSRTPGAMAKAEPRGAEAAIRTLKRFGIDAEDAAAPTGQGAVG